MRMKRSPFKPRALSGYKIENKQDEETTIYIYDEISWFGVSAEDIVKDIISSDSKKTLNIRFNSPGGSVFDGMAIYNAIKQRKGKTVSHIDGLAASISSLIALASDEVIMADNAFFMIHDPWSIVIGSASVMREEADLLDKVGGAIVNTYMSKTKKTEEEIKNWMSAETWFSAEEAKEAGFVDKIEETTDEKAKTQTGIFDLSVFANVPDALKGIQGQPTTRDLEKILRDGGCSEKQAKVILAEGMAAAFRDGEQAPEPKVNDPVEPIQRDAVKVQSNASDKALELLVRAERMITTEY